MQAFRILMDRAMRNRDESGQPASFQYTLWAMVCLVIVVTIVGVVLLEWAARRQRDKLTSTAAPKRPGAPFRDEGQWPLLPDEAEDLEATSKDESSSAGGTSGDDSIGTDDDGTSLPTQSSNGTTDA
ncbi:uncharacterized protein LOC144157606 [Haemaphysalis longicornis]